jgi:hypothetical protein
MHEDYNLDKRGSGRHGASTRPVTIHVAPGSSAGRRAGRVSSGSAACRDLSRIETSRTKISAAPQICEPTKPLVTHHLSALKPQDRPNGSLVTDFLTGTPKQLEIAVTQTKQTTAVASNRDKNKTLRIGIRACHRSAGILPAVFRGTAGPETGWQDVHATIRWETLSNRNSKLLETAVTQTKQTTEARSNRYKITPLHEAINWDWSPHYDSSLYFVEANPYSGRHTSRLIVTTIAASTTVAASSNRKFPSSVALLITAPRPTVENVLP